MNEPPKESEAEVLRATVREEIAHGRSSRYWIGSPADSEFSGKFYDQERLLCDLRAAFPCLSEETVIEAIDSRFAWFEIR